MSLRGGAPGSFSLGLVIMNFLGHSIIFIRLAIDILMLGLSVIMISFVLERFLGVTWHVLVDFYGWLVYPELPQLEIEPSTSEKPLTFNVN